MDKKIKQYYPPDPQRHSAEGITLKDLDGQEMWTDAFGDRFDEGRICVGVDYPHCIHYGEKFKPTQQEVEDLWNDFMYEEFGSPKFCAEALEREFGIKEE